MTNLNRTTFYTGVTNNLRTRVHDHLEGKGSVFTSRYKLKHLVYYEQHSSIKDAIAREKQLKRWHRDWKLNLIHSINPEMNDLNHEL